MFFVVSFLLVVLLACRLEPEPAEPVENKTVNQTGQVAGLDFQAVIKEFDKLDSELNTSWHEEQIPNNMIPEDAIEPWLASMLFLRNRLAQLNASDLLFKLVDARIKMLEAQKNYHIAEGFGEQGKVTFVKEKGKFKVNETIDCDDAQIIANATAYYDAASKEAVKAQYLFDLLLTKSFEARELIGVDKNRPKFYESFIDDINVKVKLTQQAVAEQCGIEIVIKN